MGWLDNLKSYFPSAEETYKKKAQFGDRYGGFFFGCGNGDTREIAQDADVYSDDVRPFNPLPRNNQPPANGKVLSPGDECKEPGELCGPGAPCTEDSQCQTGICDTYCENTDDQELMCAPNCVFCRDSDPRNDFHIPGRILSVDGRFIDRDSCANQNTLWETYCDLKGRLFAEPKNCQQGEACVEREEGARCEIIPDEDRNFCETPDPATLPSWAHYWDLNGERHISRCETEMSARYLVCGQDGNLTVNIIPCDNNTGCDQNRGFCREQFCFDKDLRDPFTKGTTIYRRFGEERGEYNDYCDSFDGITVREFLCSLDGLPQGEIITCGEGFICREGACVPGPRQEPTCSESDGGRNPNFAGTTVWTNAAGDSHAMQDRCLIRTAVEEMFCQDGRPHVEAIQCERDEVCQDGACTSDIETPPTVLPSCSDSDGRNPNEAGSVSGINENGNPFHYDDRCSDSNPFEVVELGCRQDQSSFGETIPCGQGNFCMNGACRSCGCRDTDPQDNPFTLGTTTDNNCDQHPDFCDGNTLKQVGCGSQQEHMITNSTLCEQRCQDGVCLE